MVYLYPHPYPVLPDSSDEEDAPESSSQAQKRQSSPNAENGRPENGTTTEKGRKRKRTRVTTEGTIALLLPAVDEDLVARQWGDDMPDVGRLGRGWWEDVEVDGGDVRNADRGKEGNGEVDGGEVDGEGKGGHAGNEDGKDDRKPDEDIEDGEIPETPPPAINPPPSSNPPPHRTPSPANKPSSKPPTDANGIPVLTKKHYHPKVIALAKKIAAQRGVKLVVDPDAARRVDTAGDEGAVKAEASAVHKTPADGRQTERNDSGIFIPEQSRTPFTREDSEISFLDSPSTPQSQTHQLPSTTPLPTPPNTTNHPITPLGKGMRGRARGRGTGRWAGHWQAKAAAAAAREARAAQLAARGIAASPAPAAGSVAGGQEREVHEEGPEAERRRRREVGLALGSSSWWNHLLVEARKARGPQWDDNTEMYQVDRGSSLYYQSTRSPPQSPPPQATPPVPPPVEESPVETRRLPRPETSPHLQVRPTSSSGRKSMGPPPIPMAPPIGMVPSPMDARRESLPRTSQTPQAFAASLPEPSPNTPTNRVSTSPMLTTNRQVPTPRGSVQGYPVERQRSVSGLGQRAPSQPPGHGEADQEALAQARLQQQHLLQRQMLAAQQAQQASQSQGQGFGSPGMNAANPMGNATSSSGGFPPNLNPAAAAYLRQQGMNPQQMAALNMFAAQQRAQQAAGTPVGTQPGAQSGMQQSSAMAQLGMMGLNPQQQHALANRIPPQMLAQLQQQGGFPSPGNAGAGVTGTTGMTSEQARTFMNMQQALAQQRIQQQQAQQQGQGQQQQNMPGQQGMGAPGMGAGINPALMAQFLQNAQGGMQGMGGQR